jgi:hypothetical protein
LTLRWNDLTRPPSKKEIKRQISRDVEEDWSYWRPIAYGVVKLTQREYDESTPLFVYKLNAAMDRRAYLEKLASERAKQEAAL